MVLFLPWFGVAFFWLRRIGMMADHRHHGKGEHRHRHVTMPAMPGSALVVIEAELVFGSLKTVLREMNILTGLMKQLGIDRASLIGNSLGGRIAWNFAALNPDRITRLVLVSPDGFASPGFQYDKVSETLLMMQALPYVAPRGLLKANLAPAYANPEALSEATLTRYRDMMLAPGVRPAILARMGQVILRDPAPTLAGIQTPTLLLWGEKDAIIPISNAADYLRYMPHARLVSLPNLGHVPFEEDPVKSLAPVELFLSGGTP
jgi:pimeloyl-ACP methyl ester carboxylesterase